MQGSVRVRQAGVLALSAVLAAGAYAQRSTISDAEIQANLLKGLASDSALAKAPMQASTAFGIVTLTGAVSTEAERDAADRIASRTDGVKRVVDQLRVGTSAVAETENGAAAAPGASAAPEPSSGNVSAGEQALSDADLEAQQYGGVAGGNDGQQGSGGTRSGVAADTDQGPSAPVARSSDAGGQTPPSENGAQGYPSQAPGSAPQAKGYPQQAQGYPPQAQGYPPRQSGRLYRRDYERQMAQRGAPSAGSYGQPGGVPAEVPNGTVLNVRVDRWLSSGNAEPGDSFTAILENDVVAHGLIAIPRGATVTGSVVDARGAGALKGRGSLTLQLTSLTLGGQIVPLQSEPFTVNGRDKAAQSITNTLAGGAIGALIGGVAGGGGGAAIGAGVGGVAGLGTSAISGGGDAVLPNEALLHFRLTAPTLVTTVSEAEMQRLGQYAGPAGSRPGPEGYPVRRVYPYPGPYAYPYASAYPGYVYGRPYRRSFYYPYGY